MPYCVLCRSEVKAWAPDPQYGTLSPFVTTLAATGVPQEAHLCPSCGATASERHLWLYLDALGILGESLPRAILHLGAQPAFEHALRARKPARYVAGDLPAGDLPTGEAPKNAQRPPLDPQALPFQAGEFHLIICDHVLERVEDLGRALAGLGRCLADDGWLAVQAVQSDRIRHTFEFTQAPTRHGANQFFGDSRRRRLFGADMDREFLAAGLNGGLRRHAEVLPDADPQRWGCDPAEPIGLFSRTRCPASRS